MPESQKILVRGADGDYWLISRDSIPVKVHSKDPNLQPQKQELVDFINETNDNLATLFASGNPGVKVGITILEDF